MVQVVTEHLVMLHLHHYQNWFNMLLVIRLLEDPVIYSLRASGGAEGSSGRRLPATSDFDLSQITDLGNSILGGDGTYPNGPDLLTIAIVPVDTASINADSPLEVSSRISWTESQA